MIYDKVANISRYLGISTNLDTAIRFIQEQDLSKVTLGRTTVDGINVFINHFMYTTAPKEADSLYEAHEEYLDLHVIRSGKETMRIAPTSKVKQVEVRADEDAVMYVGESGMSVPFTAEDFILVYPQEAHLPKLCYGEPVLVDKIVFKIKI